MRLNEEQLIERLNRRYALRGAEGPGIVLGIGDDAALLAPPTGTLVWSVDTSVQGTHFEPRMLSWREIGQRAFHAALSDLAAMGAAPTAALSSLILPTSMALSDFDTLANGIAAVSRKLACPVVGGNLARGRLASVTTSVLGVARRPVLRSGAQPGDEIWLLGAVGLARAGLLALQRRLRARTTREQRALGACIRAWRNPRAMIEEGQALASSAHAALDVSDGLATDAPRLARASDVTLILQEELLRAALSKNLEVVSSLLGTDALTLALSGGEDYALLATGPTQQRPSSAVVVGRVSQPGEAAQAAVVRTMTGEQVSLGAGFDHFGSGRR